MSRRIDDLATEMFDLLAAAPNGLRRDAIMASLEIRDVSEFHAVKGALQDMLGAGDTITVCGDPLTAADEGGWEWSLQGDPENPIAVRYLIFKTRSTFSRQCRTYMVHRALAAGTDGRTIAGRAARRLARSQYRALEDTVDVLVELGEPTPTLPPRTRAV